MADIIKVKPTDTVTRILLSTRGVTAAAMGTWLKKIEALNPHISDINRILPGDTLLIPASLDERPQTDNKTKLRSSVLPPSLLYHPHLFIEEASVYQPKPGDTVDFVAERMFWETPYWNQPHSVKREVLINNNPLLQRNPRTLSLNPAGLLNITPAYMKEGDVLAWENVRPQIKNELDQLDPGAKHLYLKEGRLKTHRIADAIEHMKNLGGAVKADDLITFASWGTTGASAAYSSRIATLSEINALCGSIFDDAVKTLGKGAISSGKIKNLQAVESFLLNHPMYEKLMGYIKGLPGQMLPKGVSLPATVRGMNTPNALFFKDNVVKACLGHHIPKRITPLGKVLNGAVKVARKGTLRTTWVIPVILAGFSVASAPQEKQVQTLYKEGFGVLGGAAGSSVGLIIAPYACLCLGPAGAVAAVFLVSAGAGYGLSEEGKHFGKYLFDVVNNVKGTISNNVDGPVKSSNYALL
ncbi:MAG: LysM domain-containing protein [Pseudomonadota bacterium]